MPVDGDVARMLRDHGVTYEVLPHRPAFTSQEVAAASHVPGRIMAKTLLVRENGRGHLLVVIPAPKRLDIDALQTVTRKTGLSLAPKSDVSRIFRECEPSAIPPFGNIYGLPVFVDSSFAKKDDFVFQAGDPNEVVRIPYHAFGRLANPLPGDFCLAE